MPAGGYGNLCGVVSLIEVECIVGREYAYSRGLHGHAHWSRWTGEHQTGGHSCSAISWQCASLSQLPWPVNRGVQCIIIMHCRCIIIIMHCTSRLTGNGSCDNDAHCKDIALPPPRLMGVAVYYKADASCLCRDSDLSGNLITT